MKKKLLFHVHDQQCSTAKAWCCLLLLFAGICSVHAQVQYPLSLKNKGYKARPQGMNVSKLAPTPFVASPSVGSWTTLTNLAPSGGGAMTLLSDGTVLVKNASSGSLLYKKLTPDASGSYINGTWSFIWPMFDSRLYYSSQLLKDGRLYVAGGEYGTGGSRGEIYNPVTNTWKLANLPGITLSDANSEILDDGRVLQGAVGGTGKQTFLYDPATNTYTNGPNTLDYYNEAAWVKLPDGSILMVDVPFEGDDHSTERYIPSLNQWVLDAPAPVSLFDLFGYETGGACLLPNGKVIFFGSTGHTAIYTPSGNNSPGSWVAGPDFPDGQGTPDAAAAMMANGKVLCAVSPIPDQFDNFPSPTSFYEYDYVSNSFTQVGAPGGGSYIINSSFVFTFLNLPDGTILASQQGDQNLYVYTPAGSQVEEGKPVITSIDQKTCSTYTLHGTGFNGNSEGSSYGDDWQMNTNYPIVRLTSGSNVYYGRTTDWNSTGVRRGNAPDSVNVALPAGLPDGTYSLVVTANGIASDPITITTTPKTWYLDADGDGYYVTAVSACANPGPGYTTDISIPGDCNDADGTVWQSGSLYIDADGDGYDNGQAYVCYGATAPTGYSLTTNGTDCNDADASVWQTAALYIDADGDGYDNGQADVCYGDTAPTGYSLTTNGTDCNDADASVWQTAALYIDADGDGYDNGQADICYGATVPSGYSLTTNGTDCNDADASVWQTGSLYIDVDGDGYDNGQADICYGATAPTGYSLTTNGTDCNDADASVHEPQLYYVDNDHDGFGSTTSEMLCASTAPVGYATNNTDCNDADASVHEPQMYYVDNDQDGFGSTTSEMLCASTAPLGYATNNTDCNDADASVHEPQLYYVDNDHDGFGSTTTAMLCASTAPLGYATNNTDCNDADAGVHEPQLYYVDNDHDGFGSTTTAMLCASTAPVGYATNNTDCNDADASVHQSQLYYVDNDHDGFGSTTTAML
ncbi:MAG TPA: kelch repeat-containing protein, partial [Panacibacter sp.]|nr:kelch repeat-containing protein [Panacibacter sp.]